jgi:beta-glucosidase
MLSKKIIGFVVAGLFLLAPCVQAKTESDIEIEKKIDAIINNMTLTEKIGQTQLRDWGVYEEKDIKSVKQAVREGKIGGFLNVSMNKVDNNAFVELQRIAIEESPNKIPLIFGQDVIHGYKTIFPIPLGQAASWNPDLIKKGARVAAEEATTDGIRWTFAPMIDIARDPRWGRIAESLGEDPYLTSVLGVAMMEGFQTKNPADPSAMAASAKHFAGYGAVEGGRDYNAAYIPESLLRNVYLKPFKSAVDAGLMTIMSSYNSLNDVPATANSFLLKDILRKEWGFKGFVVSDWNSVLEMIPHGYAENERHAAQLATNAGVDFEMYTKSYEDYYVEAIKYDKSIENTLNESVKNLLRIKLKLDLWKNPYPRGGKEKIILNEKSLELAKIAAIESFVLLKNENAILPLNKNQSVAVIGPMADAPFEQMGTWVYDGNKKDTRTFLSALKKYLSDKVTILYEPGVSYSRDKNKSGFSAAVAAAKKADVIIYVGGEESILSGEGHSRGDIRLPGVQQELIKLLHQTGKPLVQIIMAGRPIQLDDTLEQSSAILMAWHPGTMGGPALVDVLYGEVSPSGKLPLSWPVAVGQIPYYYNHMATGRPATDTNYTRIDEIQREVFQHQPGNSSNLLDIGHDPQFPFGFGLSYTQFSYRDLKLNNKEIAVGNKLMVSVSIKNTGKVTATETVQLYVQDLVGTITRPIKELKKFQKIQLKPGQKKTLSFTLHTDDLGFFNNRGQFVVEPGKFNLWVGADSQQGLSDSFVLLK